MSAIPFRGSGDAALDGLYRRHAPTVYRYALAVVGNHADAEDVVQQTFLNAYRALAQGVKPRKAENWLLVIAHNQVRQHFRSIQGRPQQVELPAELPAETTPAEQDERTVADVLRALQHLPDAQREALVLREFEGRSYAEIAELMSLTTSALETLLFRARRSLAERLDGALSCGEAEVALLRRLDGRLARRESRRLREHLRECPRCARFDQSQQRQRRLLKGLSIVPVPASLVLFRGESAAAALGLVAAGGGAAAGGSVAGGLAGAGLATGVAAKVAAVTAAAAVTAGVGYESVKATTPEPSRGKSVAARTRAAEAAKATRAAAFATAAHAGPARTLPAVVARAKPARAQARAAARRPAVVPAAVPAVVPAVVQAVRPAVVPAAATHTARDVRARVVPSVPEQATKAKTKPKPARTVRVREPRATPVQARAGRKT